ncbi:MAG TPA: MBL fold metallo-hydrolase [Gemmatimonadales bacterium]|nr:MBL fold metallo-hydrolase [Gemmatimonadales bacterium]
MDRRSFLASTAALAIGGRSAPLALGRLGSGTRLILLGTGGGPRPRRESSAPAQVIVADEAAYVVDCGDGVARQLVRAGVPLASVRHVFITHQHSDHNADYGNLFLLGWVAGLRTRVDTWGPPPLAKITRLFLEMSEYDIATRMADEGLPPLAPLIRPHELTRGGEVVQDGRVKVTAALVRHPLVEPAFAYRFDSPDRSIVISGDTAPSEDLVRLARGADVLVHEAMYLPGVERLAARVPHAARLKEHLLASHTSAQDAGRVARDAGVGTLVLSHFVPSGDPAITDQMWIEAARTHYRGRVVVGKDLMEL